MLRGVGETEEAGNIQFYVYTNHLVIVICFCFYIILSIKCVHDNNDLLFLLKSCDSA